MTAFQFNDGKHLDIPKEANWIMTLSPKPEDFSGVMRIDYFCDFVIMEFTLIDQVMRRTLISGGLGDADCGFGLDIGDIPREVSIQLAERDISKGLVAAQDGVYSIIQENLDMFMLLFPDTSFITFERNTNSQE